MADADLISALVAWLSSDPAIVAQGASVHGTEIPATVAARMPVAALVVQPSGGPPLTEESDVQLDHQRIDIFAYGATPKAANDLRRAAAARLSAMKRKTIAGVLVHWVNRAGGFYSARDRDGQWPNSFQSFQVLYATQEVNP